eukprot:m.869775 g.869775  ORF g.869775 m.869775 type:complete len:528 (+) comp59745_c0_seq1:3340-4923(+)
MASPTLARQVRAHGRRPVPLDSPAEPNLSFENVTFGAESDDSLEEISPRRSSTRTSSDAEVNESRDSNTDQSNPESPTHGEEAASPPDRHSTPPPSLSRSFSSDSTKARSRIRRRKRTNEAMGSELGCLRLRQLTAETKEPTLQFLSTLLKQDVRPTTYANDAGDAAFVILEHRLIELVSKPEVSGQLSAAITEALLHLNLGVVPRIPEVDANVHLVLPADSCFQPIMVLRKLPPTCTEQALRDVLVHHGSCAPSEIIFNTANTQAQFRGLVFVRYESMFDCLSAIESVHNTAFDGKPVSAELKRGDVSPPTHVAAPSRGGRHTPSQSPRTPMTAFQATPQSVTPTFPIGRPIYGNHTQSRDQPAFRPSIGEPYTNATLTRERSRSYNAQLPSLPSIPCSSSSSSSGAEASVHLEADTAELSRSLHGHVHSSAGARSRHHGSAMLGTSWQPSHAAAHGSPHSRLPAQSRPRATTHAPAMQSSHLSAPVRQDARVSPIRQPILPQDSKKGFSVQRTPPAASTRLDFHH